VHKPHHHAKVADLGGDNHCLIVKQFENAPWNCDDIQVFKEEIEKTDQPGGPILDSQDVKAIFGGIPSIYDVHIKIRDELNEMISRWSDDESVGNVFLRHVSTCLVFCWSYNDVNA